MPTRRAVTACILAALAGAPASAGAAGTLTIAQAQDPGSWDPIDTFLIAWGSVATNIFDGLVQRGADMTLQPALATSWEVAPDNMSIRFHLREGVTFQNGEVFDAASVKFTLDRLLGPDGAKGPQQSNYTAIGAVNVIDDHTVDIVLKRPDPVLLTKLAGYGAVIVPPSYVQEKGHEYFQTHPIGTGPFRVADYQPKVSVTLEAFPQHWGGAPKLDRVVYRFIVEPDTQVAELQAGRIDIASNVPVSLVGTVAKTPGLHVASLTGPTVTVLRFNTAHGPTTDERVREAMILGVDRAAIIKSILQGQAKEVASFQSDLSFGYDPAQKPPPYDPAKAKALLKEAGIAPGTPVSVDFRGNDSTFREVAQAVASYFTVIGLKASVKPYEQNTFTNDIIPHGKTGEMFQMGWGGWTFDYDNTAYLMYHSGEFWNPYDKDPELDHMLEAQRTIADHAERQKALQTIAHYVAEHALELPLYNLNTIYGVGPRVKAFVAPADNRMRLTDVTVE